MTDNRPLGVREPTSASEIRQLADMTDNPINASRYRALAFSVLMGADLTEACAKAWYIRRNEMVPYGGVLTITKHRRTDFVLSRCQHGENLCWCGCGKDVEGRRKLPDAHRINLHRRVAAYLSGRRERWTIPKQAVDFLMQSRFLGEDDKRLFIECYSGLSLRDQGISGLRAPMGLSLSTPSPTKRGRPRSVSAGE